MIVHVWSVLCSRSSIDSETNSLSLFDIAEELTFEGAIIEPGLAVGPFELVSLFAREEVSSPANGETRWKLDSPGGRTVSGKVVALDLSKYHRVRNRIRLATLPIDEAGVYWFTVELRTGSSDWSRVARIPVEVKGQPNAVTD